MLLDIIYPSEEKISKVRFTVFIGWWVYNNFFFGSEYETTIRAACGDHDLMDTLNATEKTIMDLRE